MALNADQEESLVLRLEQKRMKTTNFNGFVVITFGSTFSGEDQFKHDDLPHAAIPAIGVEKKNSSRCSEQAQSKNTNG
jgi:hypothetical protein